MLETFKLKIKNIFNDNNTESLKIIGITNENEYGLCLKEIYKNINKHTNNLFFNQEINIDLPTNISQAIYDSINNTNLYNLQEEEIILTNNNDLNIKIKESLVKYINMAINNNEYKTESQLKELTLVLFLSVYYICNKLEFNNINPLIIYYGNPNQEEIYLLNVLHHIGINLLIIDSLKNIDKLYLNQCIFENNIIVKDFNLLIEKSVEIPKFKINNKPIKNQELKEEVEINNSNIIQTSAKKFKEDLNENVFNASGMYTSWQFKDYSTKSLYIDAIIEDIKTYWEQEARFRPNFKIENNYVYIPNFITKINGTYKDLNEYKKLIDRTTIDIPLTIFIKNNLNEDILFKTTYELSDIFSLNYCIKNNEILFDRLIKNELYKLNNINLETQKFICKKLNEFIEKYQDKISINDLLNLIATVITMDNKFINLIENFDFPFKIPKLVIYSYNREEIELRKALFINFLKLVGFDILIYSPCANYSFEKYFFNEFINIITLEEIKYDLNYDKLYCNNITDSIFKKIFGF